MAKYEKYAEYQDSGFEWLGEIPRQWVNTRFKFCCDRVVVGIAEAATHAYADEGVPILRSTNIRETGLDTNNLLYIKQIFADQNDSKYLYANDIITVRTGYPGTSSVVPTELDKSQCFTNLISTPNKKFNPNFLTFCLNSDIGKRYFELLGWGSAQKNISVPILQNFFLATPDILEQNLIVDFLDHETAKIDGLIAKQEKLIELLKEKRQAVISHAVTKGLNPDVTMKDSGVEWLGQVPEHWGVLKLKNAVELISEKSQDNSQKYVGMENIASKTGKYVLTEDVISEGISNTFKNDDVLFGKLRPYLAKSWLANFAGICSSELLVLRARQICPRFLQYYTLTDEFINQVNSSTYGSKMPRASWDFISLLLIPIPTDDLSIKIADFIDDKTSKIDDLITKAESAIQLMQERRTALISSAVTGKIDVRNWQNPNHNNNEANTELGA